MNLRVALPILALGLAMAARGEATPILDPANGHYYDFVGENVSLSTAVAEANASTYLGLSGYLVTITSADEQSFLLTNFGTQRYWIGASDFAVEGEWRWIDGPEAGTLFWLGGPAGTALGYSNWAAGEPNDAGGLEDGAVMRPIAAGANWNDINTGGPANFVVEYSPASPVPEPATLVLVGSTLIGLAARKRRRDPAIRG